MKLRNSGHLPSSLADILNGPDELGLLKNVEPARPKQAPSSNPTVMNFLEILDFVHVHRREPITADPMEASLARRLQAYRNRPDLAAAVRQYDDAGLLGEAPQEVASNPVIGDGASTAPEAEGGRKDTGTQGGDGVCEAPEVSGAPSSLDDILNGPDSLGLLDGIDTSIFSMTHVIPAAERRETAAPDEIARRRPCPDFWRYERFFRQVQSVLGTKAVRLRTPREAHIKPGALFVLKGQICYVNAILKGREGARSKGAENLRLHVVFDNATELDILTLSLAKALYTDKHARFIDVSPNLFSEHVVTISHKDRPTGFVYVLETLSTAPELAELKKRGRLVKIGYSTQTVDERIAGAGKEQTYLCAPVRKAAEIACFNLDPQKFEKLVHAFLNKQRLGIKLVNRHTGKVYEPQEWFTVSVRTAVEVCKHIIAGDIMQYRMNSVTGEIVKK